MKNKIAALLVMALFILPADAAGNGFFLSFHAESTDGEDNSISTYSYLKEPRVTETGYTRGLKSGSFNYLNNGKSIILDESLHLNYGNGTNISNSTLNHNLDVTFIGGDEGVGISEFYGAGLFPSNRGLSAWKKIRYEKSKWLKTKDGKLLRDYDANNISVSASVDMTTRKSEASEYLFSYNARADDAVIQAKDSTGWANRTGSRRLDSEYEALMTGNFTITNVLQEILPPAGEPSGDWLPCCFNSTLPTLRQPGNPWPANIIIKTLQEYNTEPKIKVSCSNALSDKGECGEWKLNDKTKEWERTCKLNLSPEKEECGEWRQNESTKEWERVCKLKTCTEKFVDCPTGGCPGFECIKTFNEAEYDYFPETMMTPSSQKKLNDIQLTYSYAEGTDSLNGKKGAIYQILLGNIGSSRLNNLTITGTLPENTDFNLSYEARVENSIRLVDLIDLEFDSTKRSFTYNIDSLDAGARKEIHLNVFIQDPTKIDQVDFSVTGYSVDGSEVKDKASWQPAILRSLIGFRTIALEKAYKEIGLTAQQTAETYTLEINRAMHSLDNISIYSIEVNNTADKPFTNLIMNVKIESSEANPTGSYEVILANNIVQDVIAKKFDEFKWDKLNANEFKLIHIILNNSSAISMDALSLEVNAIRTDKTVYNSVPNDITDRPMSQYIERIITEAYIKAKSKLNLHN